MSSRVRGIDVALSIIMTLALVFALTGCEQAPAEKPSSKTVIGTEPAPSLTAGTPTEPAVEAQPLPETRPAPKPTPEVKAPTKVVESLEEPEPAPDTTEKTVATGETAEDKLRLAREKMKERYPPDAEEWVMDDLDAQKLVWGTEKWGNPAQLSVSEADGGKQLQVKLEAGEKDKAAIRRTLQLDASSRGKVVLDVENKTDEVVGLAVAIVAAEWYETPIKEIQPGANRNVTFDLKGDNFKAESTGWKHTATIQQLDKATWFYLLIYTKKAGEFQFNNVRFLK